MKKAAILTLSILTSLTAVSTAFAETTSNVKINTSGSNVKVNVNSDVNSSSHTQVTSDNSSSIHIETNGGGDNEVKINNSDFEITGKITSINGSDFQINGQKITKDPNVKISGNFALNNNAHIKGYLKSSVLYATEINITDSSSSSPSNSPSSSPTSTPSSSSSASPAVLGVKTSPTENLQGFLNELFSFFKNLFK